LPATTTLSQIDQSASAEATTTNTVDTCCWITLYQLVSTSSNQKNASKAWFPSNARDATNVT